MKIDNRLMTDWFMFMPNGNNTGHLHITIIYERNIFGGFMISYVTYILIDAKLILNL